MAFLKEIETFTNTEILFYEPLYKHTTLCIGGLSKYYAEPSNIESVIRLIETAKSYNVKVFILGNGSKVLFSDSGFNGLVINLKNLNGITVKNQTISTLGGTKLSEVIELAKKHSLSGFEALVGIPASVGGAVRMNAGAFKESISDTLYSVLVYENNKLKLLSNKECDFSYRHSRFFETDGVILEATFNLHNGEKVSEKCKYYMLKRQCLQPSGKSCGSIFKNNDGVKAGFLIEKAGLKGFSVGGATVSEKHANFIMNKGGATSEDFIGLIKIIKQKVFDLFKVSLEEEVIYVGE